MSICNQTSGSPAKDNYYNNLSTNQVFTACNTVTQNLVANMANNFTPQIITLVENGGTSGTYSLTPNHGVTIYTFSNTLQTNTTLSFNMDSSQSSIGDKMIWLFSSINNHFTLNVPTPPFYCTQCGTQNNTLSYNPGGTNARIAQFWIFDGEQWLSTFDTC